MGVSSISPTEGYFQDGAKDEAGNEGRCQVCNLEDEESEEEDMEEMPEGMVSTEVGERLALEQEGDVVKKVMSPMLPTQAEVEKHCSMGHMPYRSWCEVCVKAKGKERGHSRVEAGDKVRSIPEYSWDYCFPGDELGFKWVVFVGNFWRSFRLLWQR